MMKASRWILCAAMLTSSNAFAASLMTDSAGYSGPTLDLSQFADNPYDPIRLSYATFSNGPIALPGGITFTATAPSASLGRTAYGFGSNGMVDLTPLIATGNSAGSITLTFATSVASFGAGFNYAPGVTEPLWPGAIDPYIRAYDSNHVLIADYNLAIDAPITTSGVDQFAFRGIDGGGVGISSIEFGGSYIAAAGTVGAVSNAVPEPASWAMLIAGFGVVGASFRSRRKRYVGRVTATA